MWAERCSLRHWPRARQTRSGAVRISGRCLTMETWVWAHSAARKIVALFGVAAIVIATLELWADGSSAFERWLWRIHNQVYRHELNWLEQTLVYNKRRGEVDEPLLVIGLLAFAGAKLWGSLLSTVVVLPLLGPFLGKRFDITVTPDQLIVHRMFWFDLKLPRGDALQVRAVPANEYFSRHAPEELQARGFLVRRITHPPAVVEIVHRLRRYKLLMTRRADEAEAIVVRCNEALMATNPTFATA